MGFDQELIDSLNKEHKVKKYRKINVSERIDAIMIGFTVGGVGMLSDHLIGRILSLGVLGSSLIYSIITFINVRKQNKPSDYDAFIDYLSEKDDDSNVKKRRR